MLAVRGARIFDGTAFTAAGIDTVLIDGRQVVAVRSWLDPDPPGCEAVEFPGATLMPGLIDCHVHLCADSGPGALDRLPSFGEDELPAVIEQSLAEHLAVGVTSVRDLGDRRYAVVQWRSDRRDGSSLPTIVASGPPITCLHGHCANMGGEATGVDELRAAVRDRAERGADVVKVMASGGVATPGTDVTKLQFTVEELTAVVREAHALGLPATAHAHAVTAIRAAVDAGFDGIEHCSFFAANGTDVQQDLVRALADSGVAVCPTLGVLPGTVPPPQVAELFRKFGMTVEARRVIVAGLYNAGVRIVSGTDGGINPGKNHGLLPEAVIDLLIGGVPVTDALASATSGAADACGLPRKGTIAPGQDADLLVVDGDPAADAGVMRRPVAVFLGGSRTS